MRVGSLLILCAALGPMSAACGGELIFEPQEISNRLTVGYAVQLVDVDDDGRLDIVVVDSDRVVWFANPTWEMHTIIEHQTKTDNVSLAATDIDGDGKVDFALAADWRPSDTVASGSLQWLARGASPHDRWNVYPIATEPTIHRIRFADLDGDDRDELIVVPLFGRGSKGPHFAEAPLRILAYPIPADPRRGPWRGEVLNEELHVAHNFYPTDLNGNGRLDLLVASFEGVSLLERRDDGSWQRRLIGSGNQQTSPNRGASEIKRGRLADGSDYLATIEPWHGHQVVVYTRPVEASADGLWQRQVIDEDLKWGHAVWCADLTGDGNEELIVGVRDTLSGEHPCGVRIYAHPGGDVTAAPAQRWRQQRVDPAGVATEDLVCGDLNGDGRPDLVAVGRQTKNVRIYWNRGPKLAESP